MNKLTKLLSVFLIAGAIGAGFAGVAGCKKNNACNHNYGVHGEDNGDGTHKLTCTKCKEGTAGHTKDEAHKDTDGDGKCNACGAKMNGDDKEYEVNEYYCDFKNSAVASYNGSGSKTPNEINIGKFTIGKGVYVETKSEYGTHGNVNTQKQDKAVLFSFDGEDGKNFISFKAKGASAGDVAKLCKADGTVVASFTLTASVADYSAGYNFETGAAGDVVIGKGDYYLGVNTSSRIGNLFIKEYVEKSPIVSLKLSGGKRQFAKGDTFSAEGLNVTGVKENGAEVPLTGFTHNGSSIDMSTTGEKNVTVSYTPAGATTPITQTYKINVVDITGIQVNAEFMRKVYIKGETSLDTGNLCVYNIFGNDLNNVEKAMGVTVDATTYDLTAAGTYTLKIKAGAFDNTDVKITVLENKAQVTNNAVTVAVDANAASEGVSVGGVATFTTVTNAIDYLEASSLDAGVIKTVKIAAGTYREKITTSLPNLVLWGTGATTDATTLVYNVVEGMKDPVSGNAWSLNAATLTVKGKNFKAYNLHISNDFNYIADNKKYADPQGLAVRSESDQAVLYKCHLSGNQDTLYVKEGRMYAYETQVDGNIDFIFGENKGSLYLEKCTVKAISRNGGKNEGYVTAWKGTGAAVNCIFDNCVITSDDKVGAQCMTLGRTWGAKASVAIINSKISKAYSKYAYGGATDGYKARYENMNGSPAEAKFVEYNNTGVAADNDGSISESKTGVTVLDAAGAANYTKAKIFAASNGNVTWSGAWDCEQELENTKIIVGLSTGEIVGNQEVDIDFAINPAPASSVTPVAQFADEIESWTGTYQWNGNSIKVATDTVIKIKIPGRVALTWFSGQGSDSDAQITYDAEHKATIKIIKASGKYIKKITVNKGDLPAATVMRTVTFDPNYTDAPAATSVEVIDGEKVEKPTDPARTGYTFQYWYTDDENVQYNFDTAVSGNLTLKAKWAVDVDPYVRKSTEYTYTNPKTDGTNYDKADGTEEASSGKFIFSGMVANNVWLSFSSDNAYIQTNLLKDSVIILSMQGAWTVSITVNDGDTPIEVSSDSNNKITYTATSDCKIVIKRKAGTNAYLNKISVYVAPEVITAENAATKGVYRFSADDGVVSTDSFEINGGVANGSYLKFTASTTVVFRVMAGAEITIGNMYYKPSDNWGGLSNNGTELTVTANSTTGSIEFTAEGTEGTVVEIRLTATNGVQSSLQTITVTYPA